MYKVYDLKNKKKVVCKGNANNCALEINCDRTYIYKAACNNLLIHKRFKVVKV